MSGPIPQLGAAILIWEEFEEEVNRTLEIIDLKMMEIANTHETWTKDEQEFNRIWHHQKEEKNQTNDMYRKYIDSRKITTEVLKKLSKGD